MIKPFDRLKEQLAVKTIPESIMIDVGSTITDIPKFIKSHIKYLDNNPGKLVYLPYYDRLVLLNKLIDDNRSKKDKRFKSGPV